MLNVKRGLCIYVLSCLKSGSIITEGCYDEGKTTESDLIPCLGVVTIRVICAKIYSWSSLSYCTRTDTGLPLISP